MMITPNAFTYDGQVRRFLIQFIRIMSGFQVEFGKDPNGQSVLKMVPVFYGDSSRQVAQIIRGNSENTMPCVPAMAVYINGLKYDRQRVQEPYHVSKVHLRERRYNEATDQWEHGQGDAYTVERLMPVPYVLSLKLDIWTSNTEQKLQLLEQIGILFNPAFEIQSTDNYIDWTSLSAVFLDDTTWTSRSVPMGAEDQIDVLTWSFSLPIWISPPARVKKLGVIQKIIANMYDDTGILNNDAVLTANDPALLARSVITPLGYKVLYVGNTIRLLKNNETVDSAGNIRTHGTPDSWKILIELYGTLNEGTSQIRMLQPDNVTEIIGTVAYHPADPNVLLFTPFVDTLPTNSLQPVDAIIDPQTVSVDVIQAATVGTRYLILNNIGSSDNLEGAEAWRAGGIDLIAKENDIIEFDGTSWFVSFSANAADEIKYITNLTTGTQYKWTPDDQQWTKAAEGIYNPGHWSLIL